MAAVSASSATNSKQDPYDRLCKDYQPGEPCKTLRGRNCAGGFGRVVYTNRPGFVAKIQTRNPRKLRFEANVWRQLRGTSYIPTVDAFAISLKRDKAIMVMKHAGPDLHEISKRYSPSLFLIKRIFQRALIALKKIHTICCHRDIKPENLFLRTLADLGCGKHLNENGKLVLGKSDCTTRPYRPPEMILGIPYDGRKADMFSLALTIWEIYAQRLVFPISDDPNDKAQVDTNHLWAMCKRFGPLPRNLFLNSPKQLTLFENGQLRAHTGGDSINLMRNIHSLFAGSRKMGGEDSFYALLYKMLRYQPEERISAAEALEDPFFADNYLEVPLTGLDSNTRTVEFFQNGLLVEYVDVTRDEFACLPDNTLLQRVSKDRYGRVVQRVNVETLQTRSLSPQIEDECKAF